MASSQQASKHHATQLNDNEKAKLANALKEAKSFHASHPTGKASQQDQLAKIVGAITIEEPRDFERLIWYNFQGGFEIIPPETIPGNGGTGVFVAQGALNKDGDLEVLVGPKGVIVYGNIDEPKYALLLAYHMPADFSAPKVYVEAGPRDEIYSKGYLEIENNLDTLGGPISRYWDNNSGAAVMAQIYGEGNNVSLLGANFEIRIRN